MTNRNSFLIMTILALSVLSLTGCKTGSEAPPPVVEKMDTYALVITDNSAFDAKDLLAQQVSKELSTHRFAETGSPQTARWPMRLLLTNGSVQQLAHSNLGSPPIPVPLDPISALINAFNFLGWSAKEAGKQAVNAATPNYIVRMRLHILDQEGTVWRIEDEIPLYTLDKVKSQEHVAREGAAKVVEYLAALREGDTLGNAVKETSTYELEQFQAASD
jgi:hypothetical protein